MYNSGVAQWQRGWLLIIRLLVRIQPPEPIFTDISHGVWRLVWDQEMVGSTPTYPTTLWGYGAIGSADPLQG